MEKPIHPRRKEKYKKIYGIAPDQGSAIIRLSEIITILRSECPWDRIQTHSSLKTAMIEEAYEVVDAINNDDSENLKEELGDVLLQVVFHSSLASEDNGFSLTDVINEECEKMIRRHPHVFLEKIGDNEEKSIDKVLERWENIKATEKGGKSRTSMMESIPGSFPALLRAQKIQKKAADVGFDWDDVKEAFNKVEEELEELTELLKSNDVRNDRLTEEMGDVLFSCVNISRFLGLDAELSLNYTNDKFIRRFSYIEEWALSRGISMEDMSVSDMDKLWDEAKKLEGSK